MRRDPRRVVSRARRLAADRADGSALPGVAVALLYVAMAVPTLRDVGLTWDEPVYTKAAKLYWTYWARVAGGASPLDPRLLDLWRYNSEHPPLPKLLSSATWGLALHLSGGDLDVLTSVAAHRLATVLFAAVGVVVLYAFVRDAHGRAAALAAALALVFTPRFFAHSRYAALDVPIAVAWLLAVWVFWKGTRNRRFAALSGVAYGLALATKLNAFFVPIPVAIWIVVCYRDVLLDSLRRRELPAPSPRHYLLLGSLALSPLVLVALWPWLWVAPVESFRAYIDYHLQHFTIPLYYLGRTYPGPGPWHYPFVMTAVTLPLTVLGFALVGAARALRDAATLDRRVTFLFLANALFPLVLIALPTYAYDGVRLFMPAFPFVAALAGVGVAETLRVLRGRVAAIADRREALPGATPRDRRRVARTALLAVLLASVAVPGGHVYLDDDPHENVYFNSLVGGEEGALDRGFELEYWQQAYLQTVPWLNERARSEGGVDLSVAVGGRPLRIYQRGDLWAVGAHRDRLSSWIAPQEGILRDDVRFVDSPAEADYVAFVTRQSRYGPTAWRLHRHGDPVFAREVDGAPVVRIYDADSNVSKPTRPSRTPTQPAAR